MSNLTPQRFTGRAGGSSSGRLRRALDGATDSTRRYGDSLEVAKDGRLEVKIAKGSPIKQTRRGLEIDTSVVGEMNRDPLNLVREPETGATAADLRLTIIELLKELRRTGHMKG